MLLGFESEDVLDDHAKTLRDSTIQPKTRDDGRLVYPSTNDFGFPGRLSMGIRLSDLGLAYMGDRPLSLQTVPIHPPQYQAPEVLLGVPWSYKVDIWNLGCLVRIPSSFLAKLEPADVSMVAMEPARESRPFLPRAKSARPMVSTRLKDI